MEDFDQIRHKWFSDITRSIDVSEPFFDPTRFATLALLEPEIFAENWWPTVVNSLKTSDDDESIQVQFARLLEFFPADSGVGKAQAISYVCGWLNPLALGIIANHLQKDLEVREDWLPWHVVAFSFILNNPALGTKSFKSLLGCIHKKVAKFESLDELHAFTTEVVNVFYQTMSGATLGNFLFASLVLNAGKQLRNNY